MNLVTIFTPTYNRCYTLKKLYQSLLSQDDKNFEWIIVDDGSTDDTKEYINKIIEDKQINIIYKYQENSGKHAAINTGIDLASGKYFAIVDSDDYLTEDAVSKIRKWFSEIENSKTKFVGVAGQKGYSINTPIGTTFEGIFIDAKNTERNKYGITGDKFEIYYTKVLKSNKFPVFPNEKFISEIVVWNRLARQGYYIRYHQNIVYLCNYLEDGLTKNIINHIKNSPKGFALTITEQVKYDNISFKQKMSYYSLYYYARKSNASLKEISKELQTSKLMIVLSVIIRKVYKIGKK